MTSTRFSRVSEKGKNIVKKKHELQQIHLARRATESTRQSAEAAIINVLPDDLEYTRAFVSPAHLDSRTNANGCAETIVRTYEDLMGLLARPEFEPIAMARVTMRREIATTSFYPLARIPAKWYDEHEVAEVEPYLFQLVSEQGQLKVYLEWFAEPQYNLVVNVRAIVIKHGVTVEKTVEGHQGHPSLPIGKWSEWFVKGVPMGERRELSLAGPKRPPYITVYWPKQCSPAFDLLAILNEGRMAHV